MEPTFLMLIERLYVTELSKYLNRRDKRTLKNWCYNNSVGVLHDEGSTNEYVLKEEFERAYNRAPMNYISKKYNSSEIPPEKKNGKAIKDPRILQQIR